MYSPRFCRRHRTVCSANSSTAMTLAARTAPLNCDSTAARAATLSCCARIRANAPQRPNTSNGSRTSIRLQGCRIDSAASRPRRICSAKRPSPDSRSPSSISISTASSGSTTPSVIRWATPCCRTSPASSPVRWNDSRVAASTSRVARFGGDEFVILLRDTAARALAIEIANACCVEFKEPIEYDGLEFFSGPSIGVAVYPEDGKDVTTVLKHADTAMYQAKTGATGAVAIYAPPMSSRLRDWLDLEGRLRRAVQTDLLHLQFQPKFSLHDNRLAGVEALLRWCDADHGDISPIRFIEIAEDSGLIIDMGSWVVRAACRQLRNWMDRGIAVPIAVNVSAKELLHGDPAAVVEAAAAEAGVPTRSSRLRSPNRCWSRTPPRFAAHSKNSDGWDAESHWTISEPAILLSPTLPGFHPTGSRSTRHSSTMSIDQRATVRSRAQFCRLVRASISSSRPKVSSVPVNWSGCARAAATRGRAFCYRGRCRRGTWSSRFLPRSTSAADGALSSRSRHNYGVG